eukprot:8157992-Lingulodinium_polyedra.AAC.1
MQSCVSGGACIMPWTFLWPSELSPGTESSCHPATTNAANLANGRSPEMPSHSNAALRIPESLPFRNAHGGLTAKSPASSSR